VKTRRVEKIITVDKNCHPPAMSQLPGNVVGWIEVVHKLTPQNTPWICKSRMLN
jgi:hypothetical protein